MDKRGENNESDNEDIPLAMTKCRVEKILDKQIMPDGQVNYLVKHFFVKAN
jgi:hypothetical protein